MDDVTESGQRQPDRFGSAEKCGPGKLAARRHPRKNDLARSHPERAVHLSDGFDLMRGQTRVGVGTAAL
jgi:hypothetical protein